MSDHAKYAPSSAERWMNCPGSIPLAESLTPTHADGQHNWYTAEGTVIHAVAESLLNAVDPNLDTVWGQWADVGPEFEANRLTEEMVGIATYYAQFVKGLYIWKDKWIERRLTHNKHLFGTVDFMGITMGGEELHLIDLKAGAGHQVSAVKNKQLMTYGAMACRKIGYTGPVHLTIVQPRSEDPIRTWTTDSVKLASHLKKVKKAMKRDSLKAGEWCRWCPCAAMCPTKHEAYQGLEKSRTLDLDTLTIEQWTELLTRAGEVRKFLDSVEKRALDLALDGGYDFPGFKLVEKVGNVAWHDADVAREEIRKAFRGKKILNPGSLRTPTQLKKELGAKSHELIDELSGRPNRGHALVPESDKREGVESYAKLLDAAQADGLFG